MAFNLYLAEKDKKRRESGGGSTATSSAAIIPKRKSEHTFADPALRPNSEGGDVRENAGTPGAGAGAQFAAQVPPGAPGGDVRKSAFIPDMNAVSTSSAAADKMRVALQSPAMLKIKQNLDAIDILKTQPVTDTDGRTMSALKAFVFFGGQSQRLANARDWSDVAAGLGQAVGSGIGGAINKTWNEQMRRDAEIQRYEQENEELTRVADREMKAQYQEAVLGQNQEKIEISSRRANTQESQVRDRIARNKILNLKDEQRSALDPIFKRGYYYEGDNPDEDAKLQAAGIVLPDFDSTRKPVVDNGVKKAWNAQTRSYEQQAGTEADPDDKPMTFNVDGETITASAKYFLNYKAGVERQKSQQQFTATENDKNREERRALFMKNFNYKIEQDAKKGILDKIKLKSQMDKDLANGDIEQEDYDEMIRSLDKF